MAMVDNAHINNMARGALFGMGMYFMYIQQRTLVIRRMPYICEYFEYIPENMHYIWVYIEYIRMNVHILVRTCYFPFIDIHCT